MTQAHEAVIGKGEHRLALVLDLSMWHLPRIQRQYRSEPHIAGTGGGFTFVCGPIIVDWFTDAIDVSGVE